MLRIDSVIQRTLESLVTKLIKRLFRTKEFSDNKTLVFSHDSYAVFEQNTLKFTKSQIQYDLMLSNYLYNTNRVQLLLPNRIKFIKG